MNITSAICAAALLLITLAHADLAVNRPLVQVKPHRGAPQLLIDGTPQAPLSFMGIYGASPLTVHANQHWQRFRVQFTAPEDADGPAGFQIRMFEGGPGRVWIDDLRYYEGTPDNPLGPNMQPHGDFEDTADSLPPNWGLFFRHDRGVRATWTYDNQTAASGRRSLRIDILRNTRSGILHIYLSGCTVRKGHRYTVEVSLRADPPRSIQLAALHQAPPWTSYMSGEDCVYIQQVRLAAAAGIHHHQFITAVPWPRPGEQLTFASLDRAIQDTIRADPQALITLRFGVSPPGWWLEEHPGNRTVFDDGSEAREFSVCSDLWLKELLPRLEAFVRHVEQQWDDRVIIYFPSAQHTGEWFYPGVWTQRLPGFSPAARQAFVRWLQRKYPSAEELSRAWGTDIKDFDHVQVPSAQQRDTAALGEFFHPRRDRFQIDYFDFLNDAMADAMEQIASTIKKACDGRKAVMFFYGYLYELALCHAGLNHSGHLRWSRLLRSPNIDIFASPISYFDRQPGGTGHFMAPVDSLSIHGKLWFNEDDTRTFLTPKDSGFGRCRTRWETENVHRRNFAQIFPRRLGTWYMDLGNAGWLKDEHLWDNIAALKRLWDKHLNDPVRFHPQVAVISDETSPLYLRCRSPVNAQLLSRLRAQITRIGAPVGWYLLDDFIAGKVKPARLYIFPNAFVLTASQRARIRHLLRRQRATAVWFYAPAYIDPEAGQAGPELMSDLTGMDVKLLPAPIPDSLVPIPASNWCAGVDEPFGSDRTDLRTQFAIQPGPRLDVIARYKSQPEQIAAAAVEGNGYRSVFIASLSAPSSLLRNIARAAGVWLYCDSDDVILGDGTFLAIAASSDGRKLIRLPHRARVTDALTGRRLVGDDTVSLRMRKGQTRLLWIEEQ